MTFLAALCAACVASPAPESLIAWRTPDKKGAACVSCHSPDGIELAAFGFGRSDVLRRASAHLDGPSQEAVLKLILSNRERLGAPAMDPMKVRPLQPGGEVLSGGTPEIRDRAFLTSLSRLAPTLFGKRVRSREDALAVCREVLALDLTKVPVGIAMNRLSEDGFHGRDHASLAHWIPDVPLPQTPAILAAQDRYLAKPSRATMAELDAEVRKSFVPTSPIQSLALEKYRSLLVLQHGLRVRAGLAPAETPVPGELEGNPFWQIGEIGRLYGDSGPAQLVLPAEVTAAKTAGPKIGEQMRELRLPWYWLGWIHDPALRHSGQLGETLRADYFTLHLLRDGPYVAHATFMLTRKLFEQSRLEKSERPWDLQYTFLTLERPLIEQEPKEPKAKALYRRFAGNAFRTCLWLLADELEKTHVTIYPESQNLQIRQIREYLKKIGEPEDALADRAVRLMAEAKVLGRGRGNGR